MKAEHQKLEELVKKISLYDDDREIGYEIPKFITKKFFEENKKKAS